MPREFSDQAEWLEYAAILKDAADVCWQVALEQLGKPNQPPELPDAIRWLARVRCNLTDALSESAQRLQ